MALIKSKTINFVEYTYWVAEPHADKINDNTAILMLGFTSKATREQGQKPYRMRFNKPMEVTYPTGEELYSFVKTSIMTSTTNEDGEIEKVESNFFVDAVDDI